MPYINGGGGGGGSTSPAGSNGQVQYNNSGAFGASQHFVWDNATKELRLVTATNGTAKILSNGIGAQLNITAADGDATEVGGEVVVKSGESAGQNGGDITVVAGDDTADGTGGNVTIASGRGIGGDGGEVSIKANPTAASAGAGGQVAISGGPGATGGDVIVGAGSPDGNVQLYSGDSNQYVQLDNGGLQIGATKLGFYQGAAVVQPVVPLTIPTTQNVITALVALGLIAQHD